MKVTGTYDSILQGVSTQDSRSRSKGQCSEQINLRSNPVKGLVRRQPLIHLKNLLSTDSPYIYRLSAETYNMILRENNSLVMYNVLTGTKSTITGSLNNSYITSGVLKYQNIGNTVYVLNTSKVITSSKDTVNNSTVIYGLWAYSVLSGIPEREYNLTLRVAGTDYSASFTPSNTASSVQPGNIASQLSTSLGAISDITVAGTTYQFSVGSTNNVTHITMKYKSGTVPSSRPEVNVSLETSNAGSVGTIINNSVAGVEDLPNYFPRPFIGLPVDSKTGNAVFFTPTDASKGNKWEETSDVFQDRSLDSTTMPHRINLKADGTYELVSLSWDKRLAGDQDNNPLPEFVGSKITSIGLIHNRLVFTSDYSVAMSRTDDLHNFFRNTTLDVQDTDPVHLTTPITSGNDSIIDQVYMSSKIYFFSTAGQFVLQYKDMIAPSTTSLQAVSTYRTVGSPSSSGTTVLFGSVSENNPTVRELTVQDQFGNLDVQNISKHVTGYITGTLKNVISSSDDNIALVQTDSEDTVFVYEWFWQGAQRVLHSWSKWAFNDLNIKYLTIVDSVVYVVYTTGTGSSIDYNLGKLDLQYNLEAVYIDNQKTLLTNSAPSNFDSTKQYIISGSDSEYSNSRLTVKAGVIQSFDTSALVGNKITSSYVPTYPYYVDYNNKPTDDRLSITGFYARLNKTGDVQTTIKREGYADETHTYDIHIGKDKIGAENLYTGSLKLHGYGTIDDSKLTISISTHQPFEMTALSYQAKLYKRHRSMRR